MKRNALPGPSGNYVDFDTDNLGFVYVCKSCHKIANIIVAPQYADPKHPESSKLIWGIRCQCGNSCIWTMDPVTKEWDRSQGHGL